MKNKLYALLASEERFRRNAEKRFVKWLDKAIEACYEANMENRGDILTMPIKDLHHYLTKKR